MVASLVLGACGNSDPQSALNPQSPIARQLDDLWNLVFLLATAVFVVVFVILGVALIRFRDRGQDQEPKQSHGNTPLEIAWTIVPAVLLVVMAVPTVRGIFEVRAEPAEPRIDVTVIGHQWWWEFIYVDFIGPDGEPLRTANELHIPPGEDVYLTMTSADVIHSFWVPTLNGKRDVVPGRFTNLTLHADADVARQEYGFGMGVLPGQCAEFCGLAHADMRLRVFVQERAEFDAWVAGQLQPAEVPTQDPAAAGFESFQLVCTACHQASVAGDDGMQTLGPLRELTVDETVLGVALAPNLSHFGSRSTLAAAILTNTNEHLAQWLADPPGVKPMTPELNDIAEGRILGMPNFGLDATEIEGLVALMESWQ